MQDWYSGTPAYEITILEGIRNAVKDGQTEVIYATNNVIDEAVNAAREADVAVVCVGNHPYGTVLTGSSAPCRATDEKLWIESR